MAGSTYLFMHAHLSPKDYLINEIGNSLRPPTETDLSFAKTPPAFDSMGRTRE